MNVFIVKSVVGDSVPLWTIFKGVGGFVVVDIILVVILVMFPQISLYPPTSWNEGACENLATYAVQRLSSRC